MKPRANRPSLHQMLHLVYHQRYSTQVTNVRVLSTSSYLMRLEMNIKIYIQTVLKQHFLPMSV